MLPTAALYWFMDNYVPDKADRRTRWPRRCCSQLAGLPPAIIVSPDFDPLVDVCEAYAARGAGEGARAGGHVCFPA